MRDRECALCGAGVEGAGAYLELEAAGRLGDGGIAGYLCEGHARVLADVVARLRATTRGEAHV